MEAPAHKKQKKAHLPVADGGNATQKASASGWASLTPELVGTLSKYLDLPMPPSASKKRNGDDGISSDGPSAASNGNNKLGELMNLCLVAGPKTAASIRHAYLRNNETFLLYSTLLSSEQECSEDEVKALTKGRANIRQWMQVNQDWKSRCSDPKRFQKYQEEATLRLLFPHHIAGEGLKFDIVAGRFLKLKSVDERFYDTASDEHKMRIADLIGHYLISIGNSRGVMRFAMHGDSFEDLLEELKVEPSATEELDDEGFTESSYLKLKSLRHPDAIFGNPVFATELGLAEVVQFLIEEKGLDVNGSWNGLYVWNQPHSLPLTACGLSPDISVLNYLLNVPGANFGFRLASWPGSTHLDGGTLVHWLITQSDTERHQMERIEAVLGHRTVDINAQLPSNNITTLHLLCMGNHTIGDIDKMHLLLNHGADIYSATSEESGGITPL